MRARTVQSDEARMELLAIGGRVDTLRLLHDQLHLEEAGDQLALRPFIAQIVQNLCDLYQDQSGAVTPKFDIPQIELSASVAVPLGLILNEFVTNSLKCAFDGQGGQISVEVALADSGLRRLCIRDNGKGIQNRTEEPRSGSGQGMGLMESFAEQIHAEAVWKSADPGTALWLEFRSG
jgi:two-component sensor histidine kinase